MENDESKIIYDYYFKNIENELTSGGYDLSNLENWNDDIIQLDKITITLTTSQNQKDLEKNINITSIDLKDCEKILKDEYQIPYNETLFMKKIDVIEDGMKIPKISYDVYTNYNRSNLLKLNLSYCNATKIDILIPYKLTEKIDILNSSSKYYNDLCYTATSESGTDITLKDRKKEFITNNKTVCQESCILVEYKELYQKVKCTCDVVESTMNFDNMKMNKSELYKNFIDIKNIANIDILSCYKKLFCMKGILYNYGSYSLIFAMLIHWIFIIIYYSKNLNKNIEDMINEITFGINNSDIINIKVKKKMRLKISKKKNSENKHKNNIKKSKKKFNVKKTNLIKETFSNKIKLPKKEINKDDRDYNYLFDLNMKKTEAIANKNNNEVYNKIMNIMKYNDEELNNLEYDKALKIDKRNYCQYYISLLKAKHDILFTFFNNNDYNIKLIKIDLLLFNFSLEFTINAFFFSDDTMHKIYEDQGNLILYINSLKYYIQPLFRKYLIL